MALRPRLSTGLPLSVVSYCLHFVAPNLAENDGAVRLGAYSTGAGEALRAVLRSLVRVPPTSSYCGESKPYMPLITARIRRTLSQAESQRASRWLRMFVRSFSRLTTFASAWWIIWPWQFAILL